MKMRTVGVSIVSALVLWAGFLLVAGHPFAPPEPTAVARTPSRLPAPVSPAPAASTEEEPDGGTSEIALVGPRTLRTIGGILEKVDRDLEAGRYGGPGSLSFNILFQYRQSLAAFRRVLQNPFEGPDFRFSLSPDVLGRYSNREQSILLGPETLGSEGVFLVVFFHEYQHHIHNTLLGSTVPGDLVGMFYNEMSAHLFENLLAAHLPASYFDRPFRGRFPQRLVRVLEGRGEAEGDEAGRAAIAQVLDYLLLLRSPEGRLFYDFLDPVAEGLVPESDLLASISGDFAPDSPETGGPEGAGLESDN